MSKGDIWFFGFITLWIILCAGKPDLLGALTARVLGSQCTYDLYKGSLR